MTGMRSKACQDKSIWVEFTGFDGRSGMNFQSCLPAPHPLSYVVGKAEMKYGSLEDHAFVKGYYSCNKTFVICTISHYISRLLGSLPSLKENTHTLFSFFSSLSLSLSPVSTLKGHHNCPFHIAFSLTFFGHWPEICRKALELVTSLRKRHRSQDTKQRPLQLVIMNNSKNLLFCICNEISFSLLYSSYLIAA